MLSTHNGSEVCFYLNLKTKQMEVNKKVKVIVLPTEKSNIGYRKDYPKGQPLYIRNKPLITTNNKTWQAIHLYITTEDKIKEGDWCLNLKDNHIFQATYTDMNNINSTNPAYDNYNSCKKIIATTDKSLKFKVYDYDRPQKYNPVKETWTGKPKYKHIHLPQPSESFIKKYVELGGIDEVMVEYEEDNTSNLWGQDIGTAPLKIKTSSHNTITIHSIKESWSREDMIAAYSAGMKSGIQAGLGGDCIHVERWAEKNL